VHHKNAARTLGTLK